MWRLAASLAATVVALGVTSAAAAPKPDPGYLYTIRFRAERVDGVRETVSWQAAIDAVANEPSTYVARMPYSASQQVEVEPARAEKPKGPVSTVYGLPPAEKIRPLVPVSVEVAFTLHPVGSSGLTVDCAFSQSDVRPGPKVIEMVSIDDTQKYAADIDVSSFTLSTPAQFNVETSVGPGASAYKVFFTVSRRR